MKYSSKLFLLLCFTSLHLQADDLLSSISADMKQFDTIATQTKQNEHYQPYIISVFQSKLLIDGVLVNNLFFDAYSEYLSMPLEMIKRIEVIRGPGSKVDGINAYAGSINVVTYAEDFEGFESNDKLVFKYASYDYRMGGFVKNFKTENFKTHIDFYYQKNNKKIASGPDGVSQGSLGPANVGLSQSGEAPLWLDEYSLGLNVKYKDFTLKARLLEHKQGSAYGINLALPQESDRVKLPSYYAELGYAKKSMILS